MRRGVVTIRLDLARDGSWVGRKLHAQVLRPGTDVPTVADVVPFRVGPVAELRVPVNDADGDWLLVRIADPAEANETPGPNGHPGNKLGIAYTSPWWLEPRG